ncbi:MAG: bifunctional oligoribonuclease/PAP phosphatase NrnA [Bacillota bacterium]|nr:bifunctional oligoribonuclease/PAP phosphatase NrnA [Bacillota bacterium]HOB91830.1 bifunctional oligoribonuclease/PAP phosphatase NrnA [Bacillota bacterium]HPZ53913.1 bifunctional oligoribonuclease/PAP phosphatase NrnA [Bacillota bacterium]HQD18147.1 bifunctional oligoribonuclease/PAP phosphatase NrnA [Bacillota bacterium]
MKSGNKILGKPAERRDSIKQVVSVIESGRRFLLSSHVNPDGDSVGSACALRSLLLLAGKEATVVFRDPIPPQYRFVSGAEHVILGESAHSLSVDRETVGVILDCAEFSRIGDEVAQVMGRCGSLIIIDHHVIGDKPGQAQDQLGGADCVAWLVDSSAAATGELVYDVAMEFGWEIDSDVATSLYVALSTDTGSFKYSNTSSRCLRIAAELVDAGAMPGEISDQVFDTKPIEYVRFLSHALQNLKTAADGRIAYLVVTEESLAAYGARSDELEGLVNYVRMVDTADYSVLFSPGAEDEVKISFRCRRGFRVDGIARHFGGGGHRYAAGARVHGRMDEVVDSVITYVAEVLESRSEPD